MAYNKKHHFEENLAIIRRTFDLAKTGQTASPQDLALLKRYSGFGGLKCVLLPADSENDKRHWAKSELNLFVSTA